MTFLSSALRFPIALATLGFLSGCAGLYADGEMLFIATRVGDFKVGRSTIDQKCFVSHAHDREADSSTGSFGLYSDPPYDDNLKISFRLGWNETFASENGRAPHSLGLVFTKGNALVFQTRLKANSPRRTEFSHVFENSRDIIDLISEADAISVTYPDDGEISNWAFDGEVVSNALRLCMPTRRRFYEGPHDPDLFRGPDALGVFWQEPEQ